MNDELVFNATEWRFQLFRHALPIFALIMQRFGCKKHLENLLVASLVHKDSLSLLDDHYRPCAMTVLPDRCTSFALLG